MVSVAHTSRSAQPLSANTTHSHEICIITIDEDQILILCARTTPHESVNTQYDKFYT